MTRRWIGVLAAGAVVAVAAAPLRADAALCRTKKSGALFVRDACKRKEIAVDLPKGDPGPKGASSIRVHALDANGTPIGHVNAHGDLVIQKDGVAIHARASLEGFARFGSFYFEAASCTGNPLVFARTPLYQLLNVVGADAYYAGAPIESHTVLSVRANSSGPTFCMGAGQTYDAATETCCSNFGSPVTQSGGPGIAFDLSEFTPPLRVEVER